jgi:hypothetical protein
MAIANDSNTQSFRPKQQSVRRYDEGRGQALRAFGQFQMKKGVSSGSNAPFVK